MTMDFRVETCSYPMEGTFRISRGGRTAADVLVVHVEKAGVLGRGECVPYARYGETLDTVREDLEALAPVFSSWDGEGAWDGLCARLKTFSGRNAFDCALWDWRCKRLGVRAWELLGKAPWRPLTTAYTLSLDTPEAMGKAAARQASRPLLKLKLGSDGDRERILAVREGAPKARLIVDANEGWSASECLDLCDFCASHGVELIEQPVPASEDAVLRERDRKVLVCADEALHGGVMLKGLADRYDAVNLKLDKAGGLTPALGLLTEARSLGLRVMVGCMVGSSLAMAPAFALAQAADYVDLDGPLLLAKDCDPPFVYEQSLMFPPKAELWG